MEVVIDISDYVNSSAETIELVVSDKVSGFRGRVLDAELVQGGEVIDFRFKTGKVIPDNGMMVEQAATGGLVAAPCRFPECSCPCFYCLWSSWSARGRHRQAK